MSRFIVSAFYLQPGNKEVLCHSLLPAFRDFALFLVTERNPSQFSADYFLFFEVLKAGTVLGGNVEFPAFVAGMLEFK